MNSYVFGVLSVALILLCPLPSHAAEYVLGPGPEGYGTVGAFATIQEALDAAVDGDVITLLPGTYQASLWFPKKAVTLRGDPSSHQDEVILDSLNCPDYSSGSCRVLSFNWEGEAPLAPGVARVEGLTLLGPAGRSLEALQGGRNWGGVSMYAANPTLSRVTISGGVAGYGGGVSIWYSSPLLENVTVINNVALQIGGGIYAEYGAPVFSHVTVTGNVASFSGGGMWIGDDPADVVLHNSVVAFNVAGVGPNLYVNHAELAVLSLLTYSPDGGAGIDGEGVSGRVLVDDPLFYNDPTDGSPFDDDHFVRGGSPLVGAGEPTAWDPAVQGFVPLDSPPDLGALVGQWASSADVDGDGAPDDWERRRGLDPLSDSDFDGDGLTDGTEFELRTDPGDVDTDDDGLSDGVEAAGGFDPRDGADPERVPGEPGRVDVPSHYATLEEALRQVGPGATIRLEPGQYTGHWSWWYKPITLSGEGGGVHLEGDGAGPVLGVFGASGGSSLRSVQVSGGRALRGGGLFLIGAQVDLQDAALENNEATQDGGGLFAAGAELTVINSHFWRNSAGRIGGGISTEASQLRVSDSHFEINTAGWHGGGISGSNSDVQLSGLTMEANVADGDGGALHCSNSEAVVVNSLIQGGHATGGGGIWIGSGSGVVSQVTLVSNSASDSGGAIRAYFTSLTLHNSILAFNRAIRGAGTSSASSTISDRHTLRYQSDIASGGSADAPPWSANPLFYDDPTDAVTEDDDWHLRGASPALGAGEPTAWDMDAQQFVPLEEAPDLGVYGGPGTSSQDLDGDGAPDEWEEDHGLNLSGNSDQDNDGLTDAQEYSLGTDPNRLDSDGDGVGDGAEIESGTDPRDWADPPPDPADPGVVQVPVHFATLQDAVNAVADGTTIRVGEGRLVGTTQLLWRSLVIEGAGSGSILDGQGMGTTLSVVGHPDGASVRNLSITGGASATGGGLYIEGAFDSFEDLLVQLNSAESGAGVYVAGGSPEFSRVTLLQNSAATGGGLVLNGTDARLLDCIISHNESEGDGGGVLALSDRSVLSGATISSNFAGGSGAGLYLSLGAVVLEQSNVVANYAAEDGGGVYAYSDDSRMEGVTLSLNSAAQSGGGASFEVSASDLSASVVTNNRAALGGGVYVNTSSASWQPWLSSVRVEGNSADKGGGVYWRGRITSTGTIDVQVRENVAAESGGGLYLLGQGGSLGEIFIVGNSSGGDGGGLFTDSYGVGFSHLVVTGNVAGRRGGGVFATDEVRVMRQVVITENRAASSGGGIHLQDVSGAELSHLTVAYNTSSSAGGAISTQGSTLRIHNSILAFNEAPTGSTLSVEAEGSSAAATLDHVLTWITSPSQAEFEGLAPAGTFMSGDPLFLDGPMDLRLLSPLSPAIDAGSTSGCYSVNTGKMNAPCFDPDGTLPAVGAYGGPEAHLSRDGDPAGVRVWWPEDSSGNAAVYGWAAALDCDDTNRTIYPGAAEICEDGIDQNCNGSDVACIDHDGDGDSYAESQGDCDDTNGSIYPSAAETCEDGIDQDCDGKDVSCLDHDGDADDFSESGGDCDDTENSVHPGAEEVCQDGIDQDCDGADLLCADHDADVDGYTEHQGDCDDTASTTYPAAPEICDDGIDSDCSGADLDCLDADNDGDGWTENEGDCDDTLYSINPGERDQCGDGIDANCLNGDPDCDDEDNDFDEWTENEGDCNDGNPHFNPGAVDKCGDGVDKNCDGHDTDCRDQDDDLDGWTENEGDCDDTDLTTYPQAPETCDDGVDSDCSGEDLGCLDSDEDGDGSTEHQGDCDDRDPAVAPGVEDRCEDGLDADCSGDDPRCSRAEGAGCQGCSQPSHSPQAAGTLLTLTLVILARGRRYRTALPT